MRKSTVPRKREASRKTARIGFQLPNSAVYNVAGYCAAELAIDAANRKGKLPFKIQLVPIIDEHNDEVGRKAAQKFVDDPTSVGVLGPLNSGEVLMTQDIYHSGMLAELASEASSPLLTRKGYKNFFRLVPDDEVQGRDLAKVAVKYLNAKTIAVLHDNAAWGKPIAEIFSAECELLGRKPVLIYGFREPEQNLDFEELVRSTVAVKPDLVYFAIYWHKAHIIAHKLRYAGLGATFLGSDALKPVPFLEVPSLDVIKPYHTLAGVDMRLKPSARKFFIEFASKYPMLTVAPQYAPEAYDCTSLLIEALRRAHTVDRNKVLSELQNMKTYKGAIGTIRFDEKGDLVDPEIGLYQCDSGIRKYLGSVRELTR